jgi:hypothetical protein
MTTRTGDGEDEPPVGQLLHEVEERAAAELWEGTDSKAKDRPYVARRE